MSVENFLKKIEGFDLKVKYKIIIILINQISSVSFGTPRIVKDSL